MPKATHAESLMPVEQALASIDNAIKPINETEQITLSAAMDRVVAEDIVSPFAVPSFDNSAMDGYAIRCADLARSKICKLIGTSYAGNAFDGKLGAGECVRIMTGAELPEGADAVVMQENVLVQNSDVQILVDIQVGEAVRRAGCDIEYKQTVIAAGTKISPIHIGLIASLGLNTINVFRRVKVAVISTGDELLAQGEPAQKGKIFDTNRPMLLAMLQRLGAETRDFGIIADNLHEIREAFLQANKWADCVVTSGGVSVGDADYVKQVLGELGKVELWKLALKPGKPLAFGSLSESMFFGLPGNPVSAAVTFDIVAAPAIQKLQGGRASETPIMSAIAAVPFKKAPGRCDYQRAYCSVNEDGDLQVVPMGRQSSAVLSSFSTANAYAVLEQARGDVKQGERVNVQLFASPLV